MYAMSSDPFVRSPVRSPVMLAIEQCAQSDFTVSRRYAATRSGERRGEGGEREAAKGTSAKPAPSPSLLSPIESRLARLGLAVVGRNNVLGGCAEYLASKQARNQLTVVNCRLQCRRGAKRRKVTKWTFISPIVKYHGSAPNFYLVHF